MSDETQSPYRIADDDESTHREQQRLETLARIRDPRTIRFLEACEPQPGWHCLEVGAGSGGRSGEPCFGDSPKPPSAISWPHTSGHGA